MERQEKINRMFGRVVNAIAYAPVKNKPQRDKKAILDGMMQVLMWLMTPDPENEEKLIARIADLAGVEAKKL